MRKIDWAVLSSNIESIAKYDFENQKVFGSAYAVMQNNEIVYKKCFGHTSSDRSAAVTERTLFRMASMTKPITAFAALLLVDRGCISLTDEVGKYLPELAGVHVVVRDAENRTVDLGEVKRPPIIRDLLTHTSGIGSEAYKLRDMTEEDKRTLDDSIRYLVRAGLDFEPSTKQMYSGFGAFDVLVKIIERVTKTDYQSFLKREIFDVCGMTNTTFVPTKEQWDALIRMHCRIDGQSADAIRKENCIFENFPCTHFLGGAGLVSTLEDYLKFATVLLHRGATPERRLMSEATFSLMDTPWVSESVMPGNERWGLGVRVIVNEAYHTLPVGTFGWSGAYGTHFWVDPEDQIVAVYMKNSLVDGGAANESARKFEAALKDALI